MSTSQIKLPTIEGENKQFYEGPDTSGYDIFKVNDLDKGDIYTVEAVYLTDIYKNEYDIYDKKGNKTGEKTIKYSASLHLTNHTSEWKIKERLNFKSDDDYFEAIQKSALFDLVDSLIEYNEPESIGKFNVWKGSFKEWQEHFNQLENINVVIVEHSFGDESDENASTYNTVRFTKEEPEEEGE